MPWSSTVCRHPTTTKSDNLLNFERWCVHGAPQLTCQLPVPRQISSRRFVFSTKVTGSLIYHRASRRCHSQLSRQKIKPKHCRPVTKLNELCGSARCQRPTLVPTTSPPSSPTYCHRSPQRQNRDNLASICRYVFSRRLRQSLTLSPTSTSTSCIALNELHCRHEQRILTIVRQILRPHWATDQHADAPSQTWHLRRRHYYAQPHAS